MRLIVSRKGFTEQALSLATHEGIGCLSLLPDDPAQCGFSVGEMWYGMIRVWRDVYLSIQFASPNAPIATFDSEGVRSAGKSVMLWFLKELFTTHCGPANDVGSLLRQEGGPESPSSQAWR
jgi:hypothetical protein